MSVKFRNLFSTSQHLKCAHAKKIKAGQRGAALLTVLVAMMIISIMLFEFQYASMVERKLAYNELNQLQAYYLAKSGIRIGLLRVALFGRSKNSPQIKQLTKNVPNMDSYLDAIWSLPLPAFPPSRASLSEMTATDKAEAEQTLKETKVTDGQSSHVITTEGSKINLNFLEAPPNTQRNRLNLRDKPQALHEYVAQQLINLIDGFLKESENPFEEYGNLKPEEVVMNIMDWVSPGQESFLGGNKDSFYSSLVPPYTAKGARFYTVEELKLVRGIDSHLFTKLKPHVTVYSYEGKININSSSDRVIKSLYADFTDDDITRLNEEKERIGGAWASESQFVDTIAGTLNRPGFKTLYSDPKQYPFTVGSKSFLIESIGTVKKSASSVQRVIRVAVAFTSGSTKGGEIDFNVKDEATCNKERKLWNRAAQVCLFIPTNQEQCTKANGGWESINGKMCCRFHSSITSAPVCPDANAKNQGQSLKVLYWNEA